MDADSGDSAVVRPQPQPKQKRRRKVVELVTTGTLTLFLLIVCRDGFGKNVHFESADEEANFVDATQHFIYGFCVGQWKLLPADGASNDWQKRLHKIAGTRQNAMGFIEYHAVEWFETTRMFSEFPVDPLDTSRQILNKMLDILFMPNGRTDLNGKPLRELLPALETKYNSKFWWTAATAKLTLGFTLQLMDGSHLPFYAVPIRKWRAPRASSILGFFPTSKQIKMFTERLRGENREPKSKPTALPRWHAWPAERVFKWVRASRNLKCVRKIEGTRNDFAELMDQDLTREQIAAIQQRPAVAHDVVRRGRIRLDLSMMLAFRHWWQNLNVQNLVINLFMDASPQKRGYELFSCSMDLVFLEFPAREYCSARCSFLHWKEHGVCNLNSRPTTNSK
jgi:hypothetical protein